MPHHRYHRSSSIRIHRNAQINDTKEMVNLTPEDRIYLQMKLREDFDTADARFRGDFQRYEYRMELIERANRWGFRPLAHEMKNDILIESK